MQFFGFALDKSIFPVNLICYNKSWACEMMVAAILDTWNIFFVWWWFGFSASFLLAWTGFSITPEHLSADRRHLTWEGNCTFFFFTFQHKCHLQKVSETTSEVQEMDIAAYYSFTSKSHIDCLAGKPRWVVAEVAGCDSELICEIQQEARDASRGVREGKRIWGGWGGWGNISFFLPPPPAEIRFQTWNLN